MQVGQYAIFETAFSIHADSTGFSWSLPSDSTSRDEFSLRPGMSALPSDLLTELNTEISPEKVDGCLIGCDDWQDLRAKLSDIVDESPRD